jgi:hypothetical protein
MHIVLITWHLLLTHKKFQRHLRNYPLYYLQTLCFSSNTTQATSCLSWLMLTSNSYLCVQISTVCRIISLKKLYVFINKIKEKKLSKKFQRRLVHLVTEAEPYLFVGSSKAAKNINRNASDSCILLMYNANNYILPYNFA